VYFVFVTILKVFYSELGMSVRSIGSIWPQGALAGLAGVLDPVRSYFSHSLVIMRNVVALTYQAVYVCVCVVPITFEGTASAHLGLRRVAGS